VKRKTWALAALAVVALIGAGCSNGSAENGNSGTGTGTGNGSGGNTNATNRDKTVDFAACMRENGVTEFPDPNAGGDQEFVDGIKALDPSSAAWKKAIGACKDLRPPGLLGGKASPQEMRPRLEFAQCMRDDGVEDFPDPTKDAPLIDTTRIPSAAGRGARSIPGFQAAVQTCRDVLADALAGK
jgi:hypothetical protein